MEINIILRAPDTINLVEQFIQEQSMGDYLDLPFEVIRDSKSFLEFCRSDLIEHLSLEIGLKFKELGAKPLLRTRITNVEILPDDRLLVKLEPIND